MQGASGERMRQHELDEFNDNMVETFKEAARPYLDKLLDVLKSG